MSDNCYLITAVTEGKPQFGKVFKILAFELNTVYLVMSRCKIEFYEPHLLAYAISNSTDLYLISVTNLSHPFILHSRRQFFRDQIYLSPNHFLL